MVSSRSSASSPRGTGARGPRGTTSRAPRKAGPSQRPPAPEPTTSTGYRRTGGAFLLIALGIVMGLREWFGISGLAGGLLHHIAAGPVGILGLVIPLLLIALGVTNAEHRDQRDEGNKMVTPLGARVAQTNGQFIRQCHILCGICAVAR